MKTFNIAVIKGDGIGPEIVDSALEVMEAVGEKYGCKFNTVDVAMGGAGYDLCGDPCAPEQLEICKKQDAVLLGAVGGPKWDHLPGPQRPEQGLLRLRKGLGLYANLRPAVIYNSLKQASPLKDEIVEAGVDLLVVRELTGGIYFGEHKTWTDENGLRTASDIEIYNEDEIRRIAVKAFEVARTRRNKVTSVDKANVLDASKLWRKVVEEVHADYMDVELDHLYVDNAAMQLVRNPGQFDVILTNNIFGDILSDEASQITGSIGMLASASAGDMGVSLYEPIHGSAPDIAGRDIANPLATILSCAMMLRLSFGMDQAAKNVEDAVEKTLEDGIFTGDIASENTVGTKAMTKAVLERL